MSTKLSLTKDINGYNAFGLIPSQDIYAGSLAASVEQHFTVPGNNQYWLAIFSYTPGANIWVDFATTATVPTTTVAAVSTVLNPAGRVVKAGSVISYITADSTTPWICIELQAINNYAGIS